MKDKNKLNYILMELSHHLPYSIFGVTAGIIFMGILSFIANITQAQSLLAQASSELFHVFHPAHILFSAVATTAMFWKHDNQSKFKAVVVGATGSLFICGISDIIIPFFGGLILGQEMQIHICLIDEPVLIYPFMGLGILAGFMVTKTFEQSTEYSHGVHVFLSSTASILYMISYGMAGWMHAIAGVFMVTLIAVMFPCCLSDIIFPMCCTHKYCKHSEDEGRHHV